MPGLLGQIDKMLRKVRRGCKVMDLHSHPDGVTQMSQYSTGSDS